jgi:hypothetical protein
VTKRIRAGATRSGALDGFQFDDAAMPRARPTARGGKRIAAKLNMGFADSDLIRGMG